jgi:tetratricopeptide (TPR) repeat protein
MRSLRLALGIAVLWTLLAPRAEAQVIRVAGTVKDEGGRPVRGAVITAENPEQAPPVVTSTSNEKGQFGIIGIRRGMWTFTVRAPGFEPTRFQHPVMPGPRQPQLDVRLLRSAVPETLALEGLKATDIQARIDRAQSLTSNGDLDGAIKLWRELLEQVPALTTIHLQIGALYERKPDVERALESYRRLLEIDPGNDRARAAVERLSKAG